jgi:hypothetical protein
MTLLNFDQAPRQRKLDSARCALRAVTFALAILMFAAALALGILTTSTASSNVTAATTDLLMSDEMAEFTAAHPGEVFAETDMQ